MRPHSPVWTMALARALELALSIPIRVSIQRLRGVRGSEVAGLTRGRGSRQRHVATTIMPRALRARSHFRCARSLIALQRCRGLRSCQVRVAGWQEES